MRRREDWIESDPSSRPVVLPRPVRRRPAAGRGDAEFQAAVEAALRERAPLARARVAVEVVDTQRGLARTRPAGSGPSRRAAGAERSGLREVDYVTRVDAGALAVARAGGADALLWLARWATADAVWTGYYATDTRGATQRRSALKSDPRALAHGVRAADQPKPRPPSPLEPHQAPCALCDGIGRAGCPCATGPRYKWGRTAWRGVPIGPGTACRCGAGARRKDSSGRPWCEPCLLAEHARRCGCKRWGPTSPLRAGDGLESPPAATDGEAGDLGSGVPAPLGSDVPRAA